MKNLPNLRFLSGALLSGICLTAAPGARALDFNWTNPGVGNWNDPLNWNTGVVPNKIAEWGAANVNNGGTAIVSNLVPAVSEAWAGNSGVAGTIIVTNGGTLPVDNWLVVGRTGAGGNTPLSTLIVGNGGVVNKTGDGFIVGDGTSCTGHVYVVGNGQVNVTGGWNGIGNGAGGVGYLTLQDNAVYSLSGGRDFNIGDYGTGQGYALIKDNATLNVLNFWVGKAENSFGVLTQTGGKIVGGIGGNEWCIGGDGSAHTAVYGFYNLIGGAFVNPNNLHIARYGVGLLYQSGGSITQGGWCAVGRQTSGKGVLYITGGQFVHTNTGNSLMVAEGGSRGEMTVAGTGTVIANREFAIGNGGTGFLNLNGGSFTAPRIRKWSGSGYLNLNGGTLKPLGNDPAFMSGLNEARVFSGNAIIDTAGFDIGIDQPLLGAVGSGVISIPVSDGGADYKAPPLVQITGDGIGAQAVAIVDTASGKVTSIVVTCPGIAYSQVFSIDLIGGGASIPATPGNPVIGAVASGGLVKNGAGTLTLNGANDYTGATVVNAGGLVMNTAALTGGAITLANGTSLGLRMHAANAQLFAANITLGASGDTTLNMDLGAFGNPLVAPLSTPGTLAVNGTVTINVNDDYPQLGAIPLIQYGTRSGSGSFVLGPLPTGVTGNLATNVINKTIDLVITAVAAPRWDGQAGGTWDLAQTLNWTELSTGLPTYYSDGLVALFDDAALGTTIVNLTNTVTPGGVLVNNTNLAYTITGTGKISGGGSVTKKGTNSLTVLTMNDYTGPTVIQAGTVSVTNLANGGQPSNIGKSTSASANLALAGGTLNYAGAPAATDRGYAVQAAGTGIGVQSDLKIGGKVTAAPNTGFVKSGPAKLTYSTVGTNELSGGAFPGYNILEGTVLFDGTAGTQVNNSKNEFFVGSTPNASASMVLSNTTLNIESWLAVGRGNGSVGHLSTLSLYDSKLRSGAFSMGYANNLAGNLASQVFTLNGNSTFTNNGDMNIGENGGSSAAMFLNGNSTLHSEGRLLIGHWSGTSTGAVTIADSATVRVNAWMSITDDGGVGTLTMKNNGKLSVRWDLNVTDRTTGDGTFNLMDSASVVANNYFIGKRLGGVGVVNQTGGSAIGRLGEGNEYHIGFEGTGTWNLSAGSIIAPNHWFIVGRYQSGPGTFNVTGGYVNHGTNDTGKLFRVGEDGTGVLNLSGAGVIETACNEVTIGWNASGNGTVNLDGGVFQARRIIGGAGSSVFNFNGGVLRAGPNANANFMTALTGVYVNAGGAKIDTGTNNIAINQDIQPGAGSGGLTISGTGALALNGNCSYIGSTVVSSGGLGGNGTLSSPVSVQAGGFLSPGTSVGALTINNTLNLAGTTIMEIDAAAGTNDQVLGVTTLTYGGTLVLTNIAGLPAVGTVYKLFTAGSYSSAFTSVVSANPGITYDSSKLNVDGTVKVLTSVNTTPISIQTSNGLGGLTVSWPADHIGWTLQAQTNPISIGLSNNWAPVPGSTTTNQVTIPINPANGTVFLRLVLP